VKEFSTRSYCAIRASAASATLSAESLPHFTACAISVADSRSLPEGGEISGCKDTGRLGFVRQRKLVDKPRQPHGHYEIGPHCGPPGILDRKREGFRDGIDIFIKRISSHVVP
jgi:hypothetical protein